MKIIVLLLTAAMLQVHARGVSQTVTLSVHNSPLEKVFREIKKQTGYNFLYTDEQLANARTVSVDAKNLALDKVLELCFRAQPLMYDINGKTIIVKRKAVTLLTEEEPAEDVLLKGRVTDENGKAVAGASVQIKGSNRGVVTNENGEYEIKLTRANAILVITSLGFNQLEVPVEGKTFLAVSLKTMVAEMNELVVIGYGQQRRSTIASSITSVSSAAYKDQPVTRIDQVLQGRAAGVQVTNSSGAPGGTVRIRIRGSNSITGNNAPLYVVDGFVGADMGAISPDDIESIQILKDAAATAIYGNRGSNGVVIMTTKKGAKGVASVNATARFTSSSVIKKLDLLNAAEFAETANAHAVAVGTTAPFTQAQIDGFKTNGGTNWQDEIFRTAGTQQYMVNVSGGSEKGGYFISGDFLDQDGIINNSYQKRYNLRSNINGKLSDRISTFINILGSYSSSQNTDIAADGPHSTLAQAITWSPTVPVRTSAGTYTLTDPVGSIFFNPVALNTDQLTVTDRMLVNAMGGFKFKIINGLTYDLQYGINYMGYDNKSFASKAVNSNVSTTSYRSSKEIKLQNTNTVNYQKLFNNAHNLDVTAVMEYQQNNYSFVSAGATNLTYENFMWNNIALGTPGTPSSRTEKSALFSLMGRVTYGYKNKYLLSSAYRADGSSKFAPGNKYGFFPSTSIGWVVTQEDFMKNQRAVSNLKLRASWGHTGNQDIANYGTFSTYSNRVASFTNTTSQTGIILGNISNPELKWEYTVQKNGGIDVAFLNGRITLNADYFIKETKDILLIETLPLYLGGNAIIRNSGSVENKGYEFAVEAKVVEKKSLSWTTWFNASFVKNRVISTGQKKVIFDPDNRKIGGGMSPQSEFVVMPGYSFGSIWGLTYLGTWKPGEEGKAGAFGAKAGDSRYLDINSDNVIDASDYGIIGSGLPTTTLGWNNTFTYKGLTVNAFFHAMLGFDKLNYNKAAAMYYGGDAREATYKDIKDRYIPGVNETSDIPAFSTTNRNFTQSTRFLEKADFLRLKNVSVSYEVPRKVFKGIGSLKLFVTATNLWTLTDYTGIDPESNSAGGDIRQGIDYGAYPNVKSFIGGCTLSF